MLEFSTAYLGLFFPQAEQLDYIFKFSMSAQT